MNKQLAFMVALLLVSTTPLAIAQMRGGGGMGQGSGMGGGQIGSPSMGTGGMGSSGMGGRQMGSPDMGSLQMQQRRRQMHTTELQDGKYRRCRQSMERVRHRLQQMWKLSRTQSPDLSQLQDQLSVEIQEMEQQQDDLLASLNDDQKGANPKKIQDLLQSTKDLDIFLDELGDELDQDNANSAKVRDKVRKTDGAARQVQKQERDLAESLGIEP